MILDGRKSISDAWFIFGFVNWQHYCCYKKNLYEEIIQLYSVNIK